MITIPVKVGIIAPPKKRANQVKNTKKNILLQKTEIMAFINVNTDKIKHKSYTLLSS